MPTISVLCPSYSTARTLTMDEGYVYCSTTLLGNYDLCRVLIAAAATDTSSEWSAMTNILGGNYIENDTTYYYYSFDFHITSSDTLFLKFESGLANHNGASH